VVDVSGSRLKLARAQKHLDEMLGLLIEWMNTDPIERQRVEFENEARLSFGVFCHKEPPAMLGTIAGDFMHNVRSALDVAAFAVFMANGGDPDGKAAKGGYYPAIPDGKDLDVELARTMPWAWEQAVAAVRSTQPLSYATEDPRRQWLWQLVDASNGDKHRVLPLTAMALQQIEVTPISHARPPYCWAMRWPTVWPPLEKGVYNELIGIGTWTDDTFAEYVAADDPGRMILEEIEFPAIGFAVAGARGAVPVALFESILQIAHTAVDAIGNLTAPGNG
jgi:hypothetical protein